MTEPPATQNEKTKLAATAVNNLAVAFVVAGFIAPVASGQVAAVGRFLAGLAWLIVGVGFHILARAILGRMQ